MQSTDYILQFIYWIPSARTLQHMMVQILSQRVVTSLWLSSNTGTAYRNPKSDKQTTHKQPYTKSMWSRYKRNLADGTDTSSHLKRAHITFEAMLQVQRMAKQKKYASNFHLSREHFVRRVNVHIVTCSREWEYAGRFSQGWLLLPTVWGHSQHATPWGLFQIRNKYSQWSQASTEWTSVVTAQNINSSYPSLPLLQITNSPVYDFPIHSWYVCAFTEASKSRCSVQLQEEGICAWKLSLPTSNPFSR